MSCSHKPSQLDAYVDGELDAERDAAAIASIATHLATCADCRAEVVRSRNLSASLQKNLTRYPANDVLRARIKTHLAQHAATELPTAQNVRRVDSSLSRDAARTTVSLRNWKLFALAASALFALVSVHDLTSRTSTAPAIARTDSFATQELINAHIRSLMSNHLTDVPSSDRHTVKPWFEGKINFSPSVFDFAADSFPLAGGRLDYATGRAMAAIVFHSGQHAINLFVWPADSADADIASLSRDGYNIASWRRNHLQYAAVSTLNAGSLARFATLYLTRDSVTGAVQR